MKSPVRRRRSLRRGILATTTLGAICLGMLATSLTGKEILFRLRCLDTELANDLTPAPASRQQGRQLSQEESRPQSELLQQVENSLAAGR